MPTAAMWEKIRRKYKSAERVVITWNPNKGAGSQLPWPWRQIEPPLWTTMWTVIGMPQWHKLDGEEKEALDKRNYAASFKKEKKPRSRSGKSAMDPKKL